MSGQEVVWARLLVIALFWAVISAIAATVSLRYEARRPALGWTASFVLSSMVAAYSFWKLP